MAWKFDPISALIGSAVTLILVGLAYAFREAIAQGMQAVGEAARGYAGRLTASGREQYRRAVAAWAQKAHALSQLGPLDALFVPRQVIPPPLPFEPDTTIPSKQPPLPITTLLEGHPLILLSGEVASGRSAFLAYLALAHAQEGLLEPQPQRTPLYVHLAWIETEEPALEEETVEAEGEGEEEPPPEKAPEPDDVGRLVSAATAAVGARSSAASVLRQDLEAGQALVLVDGWDEIDEAQQEEAAAWLARLVQNLPGNVWMVAVGQRGFGPLADIGFLTFRLREWERHDVEEMVTRMGSLLFEQEGEEEVPPTREIVSLLTQVLEWDPSILELAYRAWLLLANGRAPEQRMDLYMQVLDRLLNGEGEHPWLPPAARVALGNLALTMQQEGRSAADGMEVEEALEAALPPPEERIPRALPIALQAITTTLMASRSGRRYGFVHPNWQAVLAARQIIAQPVDLLVQHLEDPRWWPVVEFYAEIGQMEEVIRAWFAKPDDLFHTRLLVAGRWATAVRRDTSWHSQLMRRLAQAFLGPDALPHIRRRIANLIARTGDPGVPMLMRKGFQHPRSDVRAAAAQVIGTLWGRANLTALTNALEDADETVQAAVAAAIGRVGTPAAIEWLTEALVTGGDALRVEAARSLAMSGEEGWEVLREALQEEDFMTRRAAAFGLGRVDTPWSRELLEQAAREDSEWVVRSAAADAMAELEASRPAPVPSPPVLSETGWLIAWAAERGEGVGMGDAGLDVLLQALEEGSPRVRRAAARLLGMVGRESHIPALRRAVRDPDSEVSAEALEALEALSMRYNTPVR